MLYERLAKVFDSVDSKSGRLEMTDDLILFFSSCPIKDIERTIRLTKGEIRPGYMGLDIGIAEKLAVKTLSMVTALPEGEINVIRNETGDIGKTAEIIIGKKKQTSLFSTPLTVDRVFDNLEKIAKREGKDSRDYKIKTIAEMLHDSSPIEAKYLVRTICSKMRIGIADMTIIDALTHSFTGNFDNLIDEISNYDLPESYRIIIGKIN